MSQHDGKRYPTTHIALSSARDAFSASERLPWSEEREAPAPISVKVVKEVVSHTQLRGRFIVLKKRISDCVSGKTSLDFFHLFLHI